MADVLTEFLEILTGGIVTVAENVAKGVLAMAKGLFLEVTVASGGAETITGLSIFGGITAIFAGIALAIGITTRVFLWVSSLGN